jgi:hypothetical protein
MTTVVSIETGLWKSIIRLLMKDGWNVAYRYDNIDAGIDFDFVILEKAKEEILFGWDNWTEGEIKCSEDRLNQIEKLIGMPLTKGEPVNLKPSIIDLQRKRGGASEMDSSYYY